MYLRQNTIGVESVRRIANWMLYGKAKLRYLELSLNQLGEEASYQVLDLEKMDALGSVMATLFT